MADYDKGELTDREKLAGKRQKNIANYSDNTLTRSTKYGKNSAKNIAQWNMDLAQDSANRDAQRTTAQTEYGARGTADQFNRQLENYDFANRQNAALRDTEFTQASRKSEAERFEAQRNLQNAALGLFGSMNQAMNSSTLGNAMRMLENRNDAENSQYWQTLQDNRNAIQNAYDESYNQNQVAKRDAAVNAIKALNDAQVDLASNLGNIDSDLYRNLGNTQSNLMTTLGNLTSDLYVNRRNLRADTAANLSNINPNLYEAPKDMKLGSSKSTPSIKSSTGYRAGVRSSTGNSLEDAVNAFNNAINDPANAGTGQVQYDSVYRMPGSNQAISALQRQAERTLAGIAQNQPTLLDYIMPAYAAQNVRAQRNRLGGNDYFSRLVNGFN